LEVSIRGYPVRELAFYRELAQSVNIPDDRELIEPPESIVDYCDGVCSRSRATRRTGTGEA